MFYNDRLELKFSTFIDKFIMHVIDTDPEMSERFGHERRTQDMFHLSPESVIE